MKIKINPNKYDKKNSLFYDFLFDTKEKWLNKKNLDKAFKYGISKYGAPNLWNNGIAEHKIDAAKRHFLKIYWTKQKDGDRTIEYIWDRESGLLHVCHLWSQIYMWFVTFYKLKPAKNGLAKKRYIKIIKKNIDWVWNRNHSNFAKYGYGQNN